MPGDRMLNDRMDALAAVLLAVRRNNDGITQAMLTKQMAVGRSVVAARIAELESAGLITFAGMGPSTGGRAPRQLRLRAEAGVIIGADIGVTEMRIGVADLSGRIIFQVSEAIDITDGPDAVLGRLEVVADALLADHAPQQSVWGVGVGLPGPVEFSTGLPIEPPIMPGWNGFSVRDRLSGHWATPVWVDNDVNLLALGELRTNTSGVDAQDLLYVKVSTGIGAGLVSGGRLHRGSNGCAGDIGHIVITEAQEVVCRCGNSGCLEAVAGGAALAREGLILARSGESPLMSSVLAANGALTAADVAAAARLGDAAARGLLTRAGQLVGSTLATLVNFYNPSLVILGGGVIAAGDYVLAAIRESVYRRSLPLATRSLRVEPSTLGDAAGLAGAVHLVLDELFASHRLARWLFDSTPAGRPDLAWPGTLGSVA